MAIGPHVSSELEVLEHHDMHGRVGNRFTVTVVMPKGTVATRDVDEVIAPGVEGELGVLPGHMAFLSGLRAGVLTIRQGTERQIFAVGPGFLQVAGPKTTVLVDMAIAGPELDEEKARAEKAQAEDQLRAASTAGPGAAGHAQANLAWAVAQLDATAAFRKL